MRKLGWNPEVDESQQSVIDGLVFSASRAEDRRDAERYPFFRPAKIAGVGATKSLRAFCREISRNGIGLLHEMPLGRGQCIVHIADETGQPIALQVDLLWCEPCGDGWYISGGRFLQSDEDL